VSVLEIEKQPYTLWATINRPQTRNAIDFEVMEELENLLSQIENDDDIRVLVLTGAGTKSFISGGDLRKFHQISSATEAEQMARRMHRILNRIEALPCWTIACINGTAYGGGCEVALAFDFRIASEQASFGFTQGKFYLPPGWGGLTRLVEQVGRSTALEWLGGQKIINAQTALDKSLINRIAGVDELYEQTHEWAQDLSQNDRNFIQNLKKGASRTRPHRREALEAEIEPFTRFWVDNMHLKRVKEFLN